MVFVVSRDIIFGMKLVQGKNVGNDTREGKDG
jgi:hypothetical protein